MDCDSGYIFKVELIGMKVGKLDMGFEAERSKVAS